MARASLESSVFSTLDIKTFWQLYLVNGLIHFPNSFEQVFITHCIGPWFHCLSFIKTRLPWAASSLVQRSYYGFAVHSEIFPLIFRRKISVFTDFILKAEIHLPLWKQFVICLTKQLRQAHSLGWNNNAVQLKQKNWILRTLGTIFHHVKRNVICMEVVGSILVKVKRFSWFPMWALLTERCRFHKE